MYYKHQISKNFHHSSNPCLPSNGFLIVYNQRQYKTITITQKMVIGIILRPYTSRCIPVYQSVHTHAHTRVCIYMYIYYVCIVKKSTTNI